MKIRHMLCAISIMALTAPGPRAEPGKVVEYLMNEPVSLFDLGLTELGHDMDKYAESENSIAFITVRYDWERDRITIALNMRANTDLDYRNSRFTRNTDSEYPLPEWSAVGLCKTAIAGVRRHKNVAMRGDDIGKGRRDGMTDMFLYFSHKGYATKGAPENLGAKLDAITEIHAQVSFFEGDDMDADMQFLECRAPLLGTDVMIVEKSD